MAERRGESEIMRGEKACGRRGSSTLADLEKSESRAGPVAQRGTIVPRTGGGRAPAPLPRIGGFAWWASPRAALHVGLVFRPLFLPSACCSLPGSVHHPPRLALACSAHGSGAGWRAFDGPWHAHVSAVFRRGYTLVGLPRIGASRHGRNLAQKAKAPLQEHPTTLGIAWGFWVSPADAHPPSHSPCQAFVLLFPSPSPTILFAPSQ